MLVPSEKKITSMTILSPSALQRRRKIHLFGGLHFLIQKQSLVIYLHQIHINIY